MTQRLAEAYQRFVGHDFVGQYLKRYVEGMRRGRSEGLARRSGGRRAASPAVEGPTPADGRRRPGLAL